MHRRVLLAYSVVMLPLTGTMFYRWRPFGWRAMSAAPQDGRVVELLDEDYDIARVRWGSVDGHECWVDIEDGRPYQPGWDFLGWRDA